MFTVHNKALLICLRSHLNVRVFWVNSIAIRFTVQPNLNIKISSTPAPGQNDTSAGFLVLLPSNILALTDSKG